MNILIALVLVVGASFAQEVPDGCKHWLNVESRDARLGPGVDSIDLSCINKSGPRAAFHGTNGEAVQFLLTLTHRRGGPSMEFFKEGSLYKLLMSMPTLDGRTQMKEVVLDGDCNPIEIRWSWQDERAPYRRMDQKECLRKARDVFEEHSEVYKSLQYYCGLYELKTVRPTSTPTKPSASETQSVD